MRDNERMVGLRGHSLLRRWSAALMVLLLLLVGSPALAAGDYVYDSTKLFRTAEVARLRSWAESIDRATGIEVVVATTDLGYQSIEKVAIDLFEKYQIGKKGEDNGLLILIAPNQRQYRFEVGYGLEGMLPDSLVGSWGQKYLVPYFSENRYFEGISAVFQMGLIPAIEKETGKTIVLSDTGSPRVSIDYGYELSSEELGFAGVIAVVSLIAIVLILWRITGDPFFLLRILLFLARMSGGGRGGRGGGSWGGGGGGRRGGGRSGGGGASGKW